jgi:hypothetical protein
MQRRFIAGESRWLLKKEKTDVSIVEMRTAGHNTTVVGIARELIVIDATVRLQTKICFVPHRKVFCWAHLKVFCWAH